MPKETKLRQKTDSEKMKKNKTKVELTRSETVDLMVEMKLLKDLMVLK